MNYDKRQLLTMKEKFLSLISPLTLSINQKQMKLKICKTLRTASLNPKFTE